MREILFRAKDTYNNNDWVYGDLYHNQAETMIIEQPSGNETDVDKNTVGQYTGLTDKNGKKIFEGDIIKLVEPKLKTEWNAIVEFGNPNGVYDWGYQLKPITNNAIKYGYNLDILCWVGMEDVNVYCEVIGNIWDNGDLLNEN